MAWALPRLLRRLRPELAHFQHALPLGWRGRSVVTLHDLHFERDPASMGLADRADVQGGRAARGAARRHVLAVSERTKRDAIELYGLAPGEDHGDAARGRPRVRPGRRHARRLRALRRRRAGAEGPAAALAAARAAGLPLVVVGPEKERALVA